MSIVCTGVGWKCLDFDIGKERETRQDVRQVRVDIDTDVLRGEKRSAEVKVGEVERAEVGILRDNSVKGAVKGNEGSDVGRGGARGGKAVTTRSSAHASIDVELERTKVTWGKEREGKPLFANDPVVVGGGRGA